MNNQNGHSLMKRIQPFTCGFCAHTRCTDFFLSAKLVVFFEGHVVFIGITIMLLCILMAKNKKSPSALKPPGIFENRLSYDRLLLPFSRLSALRHTHTSIGRPHTDKL